MANLNPSTSLHKIVAFQARPEIGMPPVAGIGTFPGGLAARMYTLDLKKIVILLREPNGNDFSRTAKNTNKASLP
ncbi:MAG: hypothetical protein HHJ12_11995 [Glaciimonas sp.]|nr:hypothetical protein [Glaciimonas sp.]